MRELVLLIGLVVSNPATAQAEVKRLADLWPALTECWNPPPSLDPLEATVRFSLNRAGEIIGTPAITYASLGDDENTQRAFIRSVLLALAQCTPVSLSQSFAEAFAGKPVTIRFRWGRRGKTALNAS